MTTKYTVSKHATGIEGWYTYRGISFVRDDSNKGYWGHYTASVAGKKLATATRKLLLQQIDQYLDVENKPN